MKKIEILDSTLRDGAQGEGISFSLSDKLRITRALDEFGVDYVEAGNPFANPKDLSFFERMKQEPLKQARLCAFGSTRRKGIGAAEDANLRSLLAAGTQTVVIFGKSWDLHALQVLKVSLQENLDMIGDTVRYLKGRGLEVIFDAEHWFDGYRHNSAYALQVLQAARTAGADLLCLCDTNGGALPRFVYDSVKAVRAALPDGKLGIHCHNDIGCAVASSLSAVEAGADQVQGCFTGIGERCGNADLSVVIPNLKLKMGCTDTLGDLRRLSGTVVKIMDTANMPVPGSKPYVGASAFAHKAGMHVDGVRKVSASFEHIDPELVGNSRRFLLSEVAGRTAILARLQAIAPGLDRDAPELLEIVKKLKELEQEGFQFEAADASFELMVLRSLKRFVPHFQLGMYRTSGEFPPPDGETSANAMLWVQVDGDRETAAAMGNGPVHALDGALRKALSVFYPQLSKVRLVDFKVRVLTGEEATASKVRVLIESTNGDFNWVTVGVSTDIIAASWQALSDSIEYILHKREGRI